MTRQDRATAGSRGALSDDEVDYVLGLAERGESPARPVRYDAAPEHLMRLIERLDFPAFILTPGWAILGWNAAYRDLYPRVEDLAPAEDRLRGFLEQYWGGPTTYSEQRGHPRLRMRHAPFPVTPDMRDR